jgi:hypothetical protein
MKYSIQGETLPVVICELESSESMITESGAMAWMSPNMKMETTSNGGIGKAFGRMFSGESLFQNRYTAQGGNGLIAFASSFPGSIKPFEVRPGKEYIFQKKTFLAGEKGVNISIHFQKKIGAGILADGIGSICGGLVGSFSNTSFSQNVGLISLTKVASKHVAVMAGVLLVLLGLLPKLAGIINGIPQPVLGGVGLVMFGMVAAAGIKTLSRVELTDRNLLIIATSMALGLGVTFRPDFISGLPEFLQMIFSSGISTGTIIALMLNLILKEDKKEIIRVKRVEIA